MLGDLDRQVVHVISGSCSCTDRLLTHLQARGAAHGREETIVYVGEVEPRLQTLRARGYTVRTMARTELRRGLALDGAPVLVVADNAELAYVGGYFQYPAAVRPLDERLIAEVAAGHAPRALPVFGCAVDAQLARQRDPLGLR